MNWKRYWSTYPARFARTEYLRQVKNTVGGEPVADAMIRAAVDAIGARLDLGEDDDLLDLCCGNGLVTKEFARMCRRVVGVDFSETLIEIARADHARDNLEYICADVRDVADLRDRFERPFTKILMIAGMQYLKPGDLAVLLRNVSVVLSDAGTILFAAIPNRARKRSFYNTVQRRLRRARDTLLRRDQMGTWWDAAFVQRTCERAGFACRFRDDKVQSYRFDATLTRNHRA